MPLKTRMIESTPFEDSREVSRVRTRSGGSACLVGASVRRNRIDNSQKRLLNRFMIPKSLSAQDFAD